MNSVGQVFRKDPVPWVELVKRKKWQAEMEGQW